MHKTVGTPPCTLRQPWVSVGGILVFQVLVQVCGYGASCFSWGYLNSGEVGFSVAWVCAVLVLLHTLIRSIGLLFHLVHCEPVGFYVKCEVFQLQGQV